MFPRGSCGASNLGWGGYVTLVCVGLRSLVAILLKMVSFRLETKRPIFLDMFLVMKIINSDVIVVNKMYVGVE